MFSVKIAMLPSMLGAPESFSSAESSRSCIPDGFTDLIPSLNCKASVPFVW